MNPPCCPVFSAAQEPGTDNEGYGRLLRWYPSGERGLAKYEPSVAGWYIGDDLPKIAFCPWCGKAVGAQVQEPTP